MEARNGSSLGHMACLYDEILVFRHPPLITLLGFQERRVFIWREEFMALFYYCT